LQVKKRKKGAPLLLEDFLGKAHEHKDDIEEEIKK
jgi:hypothetical protein